MTLQVTICSLLLQVYMIITVRVEAHSQVPCYFIFGDSLSDNGNNNQLPTSAKANYFPYGIDFPGGGNPTGRFSNGRNIVDFIAERLGFDQYIPSFRETSSSPQANASIGVNYASGAAGIFPETGYRLGARISLDRQVINHVNITIPFLACRRKLGKDYLGKCLYTVNIGSNDYINNYFAPSGYIASTIYNPEQYATKLVDLYSKQIQILYKNGARKIGLFSLGLIGCVPAEIIQYGTQKGSYCVDKINNAVQIFNNKLQLLVADLNKYHADAKFLYVDLSGVQLTPAQGFTVFNTSCCSVTRSDGLCDQGVPPCGNRTTYVFYDNYHPTEAVSSLQAKEAHKQLLSLIA